MMVRITTFLLALLLALPAWAHPEFRSVYQAAGLTDAQAVAHLLNRFTYGPRPGEVERVVAQGASTWLDQQLRADLPEPALEARLAPLKTLAMSDRELNELYVNPGLLRARAIEEGVITKDQVAAKDADLRKTLTEYARKAGYKNPRDLVRETVAQKLLRSVYSENQLQEVLTDFWFNHFNVSFTSNQARTHVLSFERDAIRANCLGPFLPLLQATAKHPAMLLYLNNAQSVSNEGAPTTLSDQMSGANPQMAGSVMQKARKLRRKGAGLNENYARELMELHTLGVDGGYSQKDVVEVARALTGWTIVPAGPRGQKVRQAVERGKGVGFVQQGDFLFRADAHDSGAKTILGHAFPAGGGLTEGEQVLKLLASHPATAHFIARKFAIRFVSDSPPESLVKKLSDTFKRTGGDTRAMVWTLVQAPEFWAPQARRAKIKSPLELMASSMRALQADITRLNPELYTWLQRMGQPLYAYQAPTGFPDRAESWINSGTLLARMNFALMLSAGQIKGVEVDLRPVTGLKAGPEQVLQLAAARILPGRDLSETIKDLTPLVNDPDYARRLSDRAAKAETPATAQMDSDSTRVPPARLTKNPTQVAQTVGILLGSPEFQRR